MPPNHAWKFSVLKFSSKNDNFLGMGRNRLLAEEIITSEKQTTVSEVFKEGKVFLFLGTWLQSLGVSGFVC